MKRQLPHFRLTDTYIRNVLPAEKPVKMFDGGSLFLLIMPNGSKWWRPKYHFGKREKLLSLGVYPDVSLKDARERRDASKKLLAAGIDPGEQRKAERAEKKAVQAGQPAAPRFTLDSDGALSFRLISRRLTLTLAETAELRAFLDATKGVTLKVTPCP